MNDWNECLAKMATEKGKLVAKEKSSSDDWEHYANLFKGLGESIGNGVAVGLENGGFIMISRKEYDEMKAEIEKLKKDIEIFRSERDHCIDILRKIGIQDDIEIVADSVNVEEFTNPGTFRKIVRVSFQVEDY